MESVATSPGIGPPSVELPFDIYALIIDCLVEHNHTTPRKELKALSLAHRAFVAPCQKLLFSSVFYSVEAARKLVEIHDTSPHLAGYVKRLGFCNTRRRTEIGYPSKFTVEFLSKFHDLSELILTFTQSRQHLFDWTDLDPSVATALLTLLRSQSRLEMLEISGIKNFPLQGILSLASYRQPLKELVIFSVTVDFTNVVARTADFESSNAITKGYGRLATFKLFFGIGGGTRDALLLLTGSPDSPARNNPILDFSSIECLSVKWKHPNDLAWIKLLIQSFPYLRIFRFTLSTASGMSFKGVAAAVLEGHSQIINRIRLGSSAQNNVDLFSGLSHEFQQLSGNVNTLEEIDIYLVLGSDPRTAISGTCASVAQQCKVLDTILANGNAFPALRKLTVLIEVEILDASTLSLAELRSFESNFKQAATQVKNECFMDVQTLLNPERFSFEFNMEWADEI